MRSGRRGIDMNDYVDSAERHFLGALEMVKNHPATASHCFGISAECVLKAIMLTTHNMTIDSLLKTQDRIDAIQAAFVAHQNTWVLYLATFLPPYQALLVVRDWQGRFHIGVPGNERFSNLPAEQKQPLRDACTEIRNAVGPLASEPGLFFYSEDLFDAEALWCSQDKLAWGNMESVPIFWIERQSKEKIWAQAPTPIPSNNQQAHPERIVFFGIKGGVGRSSALSATAYHLLAQGKKVLVMDVDFESPGVSATLLAEELRPDYGLLDWFALDALNPAMASQLITARRLLERSGLDPLVNGEGTIWVAPAFGKHTQDYVGKLGRLYQDAGEQGYVERFKQLLTALESEVSPDVVLIDSRAGVDDTAALALTQLDAHALLFATHGRATWTAYKHLFTHWKNFAYLHTGGEDFRSMLHMVSALTPVDSAYDKAMLDASYSLFLDTLYETLDTDQMEGDGFNYGADDPVAPHHTCRIRWDDDLRHFDPVLNPAQLDSGVFQKAFGELVMLVDQLLSEKDES